MNKLTPEYLVADKITNSHVVILVSVPRTGKTTWANSLITQEGYVPVCRDDIRRALGVRFDYKLEDKVHEHTQVMLKTLLIRGIPKIIIDETNLTKKRRKAITDLVLEHNGTWEFVEIPVPDEKTHREICERTGFDWAIVQSHLSRLEPVEDHERHPKYK